MRIDGIQAMKAACAEVSAALRDEGASGLDASESGSSVCVAIVSGSQLLVANAGARYSRV